MKPQQPKPANNLNLSISPETSEGTYSNLAIITHSPTEFILDFAQMLPGGEPNTATVRQRILLHPIHAKRLLMALQDNLEKYEQSFGEIREPNMGLMPNTIEMLPQGNA